jgi:hypothetical protein
MMPMSEPAESFRMTLEKEINLWSGFHRALRKDDREAYEELMNVFRSYASEISCTPNSIMFESLVISIAIFHQKRLEKLEKELHVAEPEIEGLPEPQKQSLPVKPEPIPTLIVIPRGGGQTRLV